MSQDTELRDKDGGVWSLDNLTAHHWLEGKITGAEEAAGWLNERAVALFREGKSELAVSLQRLSKEMLDAILVDMRLKRDAHRKDFPCRLKVSAPQKKRSRP